MQLVTGMIDNILNEKDVILNTKGQFRPVQLRKYKKLVVKAMRETHKWGVKDAATHYKQRLEEISTAAIYHNAIPRSVLELSEANFIEFIFNDLRIDASLGIIDNRTGKVVIPMTMLDTAIDCCMQMYHFGYSSSYPNTINQSSLITNDMLIEMAEPIGGVQ